MSSPKRDSTRFSLRQAGVESLTFISADYETLVSFRGPLIDALRAEGIAVSYVGPAPDTPTREWLDARGVLVRAIPIHRNVLAPISDCRTLLALWRALRELAPDAVITTRVKTSVYGQLVAALTGIRHRFAFVTGLGYAFMERPGDWRWRLTNLLARLLYGNALRGATAVAFQNADDEQDFRNWGIVPRDVPTVVVSSSGVDTQYYLPTPLPPKPGCLFVGRLLADKGIGEFIAAARIVRARRPDIAFTILGPNESSPSAFPMEALQSAVDDRLVEYAGRVSDVRPYISACSIFVFPSYREGAPRAVLEAMSMGRPIITTDVPGCRETVEQGRNGLLVPVRDAIALAEAVLQLADDPIRAAQMGAEGRRIAEEKHDVRDVTDKLLSFYAESAALHER